MRKVREVLRLRFEVGCSHRAIQASTGLSKGSVSDYLKRAATRSLTWAEASAMSGLDARVDLSPRGPHVRRASRALAWGSAQRAGLSCKSTAVVTMSATNKRTLFGAAIQSCPRKTDARLAPSA